MKMAAARIRVPPTKIEERRDPFADCELHIRKGKDKKGFSVRHINDQKGKGVFTNKAFRAGEFLLEYPGELISKEEAHRREKSYPLKLGSFLFFFKHRKKELCIDGTFSKGKGRYINDGCGGNQNASIQLVMVRSRPHLAVFAKRNIKEGEEILYDYGVPSLPWRKNVAESSQKKFKGTDTASSLIKTPKKTVDAATCETLETPNNLRRDDSRRLKEKGLRSETSIEMNPLRQPPKVNGESSLHDVQEDASEPETTSIAQKRLRSCSVVLDKLIFPKDQFTSIRHFSPNFGLVDVSSPSEQNLTKASSAFKEPVSQIGLGAMNKNSSNEAPRVTVGVLACDAGAFDVCSVIKATQSTVNQSSPEHICFTTANKQDLNSSSSTSDMISGSVIEACGSDVDLPNETQGKTNGTIFDQTITKEQVSKLKKVTAEPISASVTEACATDVLLPTTAHVKGVTLASKELEKTASVSTFCISQTTTEFNPAVSEHMDVLNHGSKSVGSLSVAEVPLLKVTLATSLPQQMTKETQSVSMFECSGSNAHSSVVAQEVIAAAETTQDNDVCTGLPGAPLYLTIRPGYSNVSLSWEAPPNNNGSFAIDRYCVMMKQNDSNWCDIARVNSNLKNYTVENLQPSMPYRFCVSAENRIGRGPSVEVQADVYLQRLSVSPSREVEEIYLSYGTSANDSDPVNAGKPNETIDGGFDVQNNKEKALGRNTNYLNLNAEEDLTPESINPSRQSRKSYSDQVSAGKPNETIDGVFDVQNNQDKVMGKNANDMSLNLDEDVIHESIDPRRQSRKSDSDADNLSEEAEKKRRPYRPCPYCHAYKSDLSDHIIRKHADEEVVKRALTLPRYERIRAFRQLKKEGIMKANMQILRSSNEESVKILRERQPQSKQTGKVEDNQRPVVYCSECHGFVSSKYFARHRKNCMSVDTSTIPQSIPASLLNNASDNEDYKRDILRSFQPDAIGKLCVTDELIVGFGYREFKAIRTQKDKHVERRTTLKTKMRRLGTLFDCFKRKCCASSVDASSAVDMFKRSNFTILEDTIYTLTSENGDKVKSGLKVAFGYILKNVCKYLHGEYLIQGKDAQATEINRFLAVLNYHWASMFGDAEYANSIKRQEVLRKPQKLPKQQDIKTLRDFTLKKIQELTDDTYLFVANTEYSLLRDLVVSRLTLFNARRGGEPSRLLLEEWNDALNDVWYNNTETVDDPLEKFLLGRYKLAYQSGKRVKLVPLLIVDDCWKAIEILANPEIRKQVNVHASNRFVFPYTRFSTSHVLGWKAVEKCCQLAELDNSITATQMRHYVATIYAALEIPDEERKQFYEHMGHSEAVNKNVYQSPLAVKEVIQVGGFLDRLDRGQLSETVSRRSSNSEDSINDTRFAEMTPLNNNGCNGCYQQDVRRSDSCSVCQTCTSTGALTTAEQSIATSLIISTTSDRFTSSPVVDINSVVSGVPPDSSAPEPVVHSSTVKNNPTGTSVFAFSAVSSEPSIVPAIVYPVTIASPTLILRSSTEAVTDAASSSNSTFQEPDTTACDSANDTTDMLTAKVNIHQMPKERSAILPLSSKSKTTTPKDSGWRPKIVFVNSSRDPDPQDMDYSDSGSSCQSTPSKKRIYRSWSIEHTKTIQKCFERYIRDTSDIKGNTGPLPSADEVKVFIKQHPEILPDDTLTTKIVRIKTKVFNERKELRRKMGTLEGSLEKKQ